MSTTISPRDCAGCGVEFRPGSVRGSFCTKACANRFHNRQRSGENHPLWKGGRRQDTYVRKLAPGHPRGDERGYVLEHILVAEAALGKLLPRSVEVHHVNEVTDDNRNSNLVICQDGTYHQGLHNSSRSGKKAQAFFPSLSEFVLDQLRALPTVSATEAATV